MNLIFKLFFPIASREHMFTARNLVLAVVVLGVLVSGTAHAERPVTLEWNPSSDPSTVGYYVYSLEENATTATRINVASLNKVTIPSLKEGLRYSFKVTAYNSQGAESTPSNEATFVVPVPLNLLPGSTAGAARQLQFPMAPGHWYELQASTDLKVWTTIWQTPTASMYAWTSFQEPSTSTTGTGTGGGGGAGKNGGTAYVARFFRLRVH